ncbi:MAG: glutamate-1-semialdehyde 2,1-aminomutase [Halobacteria archaeon]|nr:glutamate-1-semialdehyde 2,1-aminomutase [Halobacteria archaeon]
MKRRPVSKDLFDRAMEVMPGGVSSPVRSVVPYPFFVEKGEGPYIWDEEGNKYIDYCMGYGPLILGHGFPDQIMSDIQSQIARGNLYGAPTRLEVDFAEFLADHVPSIDMVRFVNTGTEATMSAIRAARGYTGKNKIIKIEGGFHGAHEGVLVKAGSGPSTLGTPDSAGVPRSFTKHTLQVPFNDIEAMTKAVEDYEGDLAAVIMEPMMGNSGPILPEEGYLEEVRKLTHDHNVVLIFDEVITGFRFGLGGAQDHFGVTPDLTTLGKVAGGGFPIGIFGGKEEIMEEVAPSGDVYQAGTFSGNPVTMTAGYSILRYIERENVYEHVNELGQRIRAGLKEIVDDKKPQYTVGGAASMFKVFFTGDGQIPKNYDDVNECDTERWRRIFWDDIVDEGVFLPPSQYETQFVSYAHTQEDVDETLEAYKEAL